MRVTSKIGSLDETASGPLYRKLETAIRSAIQRSAFRPLEALPTERDLATEYAISRITVRKAIGALVDDGLLERRQGAGTFVRERVEKKFTKLSGFSEDLTARGRVVTSRWILREEGTVTPDESLAFGLAPGSSIFRFNRIRLADDVPLALEYAAIAAFGLADIGAVQDSLYAALEDYGTRPVRALQRLRAVSLDARQAALMEDPVGAPALFIERRGFLGDGRLIELTRSWYRGNAYDFVAEL